MEVFEIFPPYIFSVKLDGKEDNEYDRMMYLWSDTFYVNNFIIENLKHLKTNTWLLAYEPEEISDWVVKEAHRMQRQFDKITEKTERGERQDFDACFKRLGREELYEFKLTPSKSQFVAFPSLLRFYAIKTEKNTYLITGGGIKLGKGIQDSPDLKDHILQDAGRVMDFLNED